MKYPLLLSTLTLLACSSLPKDAKLETVHFSKNVKSLEGTLYLPSSKKPTAAVIVVHGGGWRSRSGEMTTICKKLANQGIAAFNVTYRLAPDHLYPKAVDDVAEAIQWLTKNASKYNIDKERLGGWGYSAGAHLILRSGLDPKMGLKAIVSGGTPAKLNEWPKSPLVNGLIGHPMETHEKVWKEASPYYNVFNKSPPVFLYHGEWDMLVEKEQMYLMEKALKSKGVETKIYEAPMQGHFVTYLLSAKSENLGVEFLKKRLQ